MAGLTGWFYLAPTPANVHEVLETRVEPWLIPSLGLVVWFGIGLYLIRRLLKWFAVRAERTATELDDVLLAAVRRPLVLVVIVAGLRLWAGLVPLAEVLTGYAITATEVASIVLLLMVVDGVAQAWTVRRANQSRVLATAGGVVRTGIRVVIWVTGFLMVLDAIGIDVTAVVASIGVTSLAVALALQRTLEDFLAGLLIAADQTIRVGDYVDLEGNEHGYVLAIGWRTSRIRTRDDMHVVVPNSKLATATVVNRSLPETEVSFTVSMSVHYDSDLTEVTAVTLMAAQGLQNSYDGAVAHYQPRVAFESFDDSGIGFRVWLRARTWEDHYAMKSLFIRSIHERYREANIAIPYPTRTLDVPAGSHLALSSDLE